jgi:NAD-dependent dihydropyrimidine dehydrogenase PreA subunit
MAKRKIIKIDEAKCNGCGECIPNCKEGAIQVVNGKARLVSEVFCDGLGACLGHCPQGATTIEEREAEAFDEKKVEANIARQAHHHGHGGACPGSKMMDFRTARPAAKEAGASCSPSHLGNWPVQLMLVPAVAPYLNDSDLLIAADCVPFAYADFHEKLLRGKVLLVGCPKLDNAQVYQEKLNQVLKFNQIKSITYAHMEVPCCFGLIGIIQEAIAQSGKDTVFHEVTIGIRGDRLK